MKQSILAIIIFTFVLYWGCSTVAEPPVLAPFENLDTICTNDWWNRAPNPIHDVKVERDQVVAFGLYTCRQQDPEAECAVVSSLSG